MKLILLMMMFCYPVPCPENRPGCLVSHYSDKKEYRVFESTTAARNYINNEYLPPFGVPLKGVDYELYEINLSSVNKIREGSR